MLGSDGDAESLNTANAKLSANVSGGLTPISDTTLKRFPMAGIDDFVNKQKPGARFVITAQMLRMTPQQFDAVAQEWMDDGGPGFDVAGIPHRVVVDGQFYISRLTVARHGEPE